MCKKCSFPTGTNRGFLAEHLVCKNVQPWLRVSFASTSQPSLYLVPYTVTQSHLTLCNPMDCNTPGFPVHHQLRSLLKLLFIESVMPSSQLILCRPLLLLPLIPSSIRVFSNESTLRMRWPKYWSFSFSSSPFKEIPGLISFRMDWLDLRAVQGTLKSLLQHHSSKHQFFGTQLSLWSKSHIHT